MPADLTVIVAARNEAERLPSTLAGLRRAFADARVVVADDASFDATARLARTAGAEVVSAPRRLGKGGVVTLAARAVLSDPLVTPETIVLCDGDLGSSAAELSALVGALDRGDGELAVAVFARRAGGGLGLVLATSRLLIARATGGLCPREPLSGQRALRTEHLRALLPFAGGFGLETAMTIEAHREGLRLVELELPLAHRVTGRDLRGFVHRARQLVDVVAVARRLSAR
jgi:glycosyltransferase involved in cell wall biosynthesis